MSHTGVVVTQVLSGLQLEPNAWAPVFDLNLHTMLLSDIYTFECYSLERAASLLGY